MNYNTFTKARISYLDFLKNGGIEPQVDMGKFRPRENNLLPRSSQLGLCSLAAANEMHNVRPSHPQLLTSNNYNLLHLFRSGNQAAREWTATMTWYAQQQGWQVQVEVPCDDEFTTGTIDMILTTPEAIIVIDWKRTDQTALKERTTGKLHGWQNFLQLADYLRKMQTLYPQRRVVGALVRDYRSFWRVFWMERTAWPGWTISLDGIEVLDTISEEEIYRVRVDAQIYIYRFLTTPYYDHPLECWQCAAKIKGDTYKPRCPYFGNCWKIQDEFTVTHGSVYSDEGVEYVIKAPS